MVARNLGRPIKSIAIPLSQIAEIIGKKIDDDRGLNDEQPTAMGDAIRNFRGFDC